MINAFVLPVLNLLSLSEHNLTYAYVIFISLQDGNIFVFTGLLNVARTDDELGIVLGHEIAHALLGHGLKLGLGKEYGA